jgi:hypothetical protein
MKFPRILYILLLALVHAVQLSAQWTEKEVEDVTLKQISPQVWRVAWLAVWPEACGDIITYSVFRDTDKDFDASQENRIAIGISETHYISHEPKEPKEPKDFYYRVIAVREPGFCPLPTLRSGLIVTYPLDLGREYTVTVGAKTETCKAASTAELACPTLSLFHSVIAKQWAHEFLIGCLSSDYEDNNWTCVNLKFGYYHVAVHSLTATILDAGYSKINTKTGKRLDSITPEFSVLSVIK